MRRSSSNTFISLDTELVSTLRRIRKEKRETVELERRPMENLQGNGNEEDVESSSEGSSHPSASPMAQSPRALRGYALPSVGIPSIIRRPTIETNNFEIKPITL